MERKWLGVGLLGALGWALGCGGDVVVDVGSGGGTGDGGRSNQGPGSSTSTGGDLGAECQAVCGALGQLGCLSTPIEECVAGCEDLFVQAPPSCSALADAYLQCLIANVTNCDLPPECTSASNQIEQCMSGGGCEAVECGGGSDGSCACKGSCFGQDLSVDCAPSPSGELVCECFASGNPVGTCVESAAPCSFDSGCCAAFFFDQSD
jgi:hypothetical protein